MPSLAFLLAVVAAICIVYGRIRKRLPVAILGFALLAVAALVYYQARTA